MQQTAPRVGRAVNGGMYAAAACSLSLAPAPLLIPALPRHDSPWPTGSREGTEHGTTHSGYGHGGRPRRLARETGYGRGLRRLGTETGYGGRLAVERRDAADGASRRPRG